MNLRFLKILVITMGVMLVGGVIVLAVAIAGRLAGHRTPPPGTAFNAPPINLPAGAKIEALSTGPDRIVIELKLADDTRQLLVIDLQTGRLLGTVPIHQP